MDIKLSKRMQAVANMVKEKKVVDIGCDHAFVSIYLAGKSSIDGVIAMDVKTGPVDIARANVEMHNLSDKIQVRMSDGFENLREGEADVAIIAGMGGYLMIDILEGGRNHLGNGISLILQPQSDIKAVREYLVACGYEIEQEDMLVEEGKYYSIIRAVPASHQSVNYLSEEYMYGPKLLEAGHPVLKEYLIFSRDKNIQLEDRLLKTDSLKSQDRIAELKLEIEDIDRVLQKYF